MCDLPIEKHIDEKGKSTEKQEEWIKLLKEIMKSDDSSEKEKEAMEMLCGEDLSTCCPTDMDCPLRDSFLIATGRKVEDDKNST